MITDILKGDDVVRHRVRETRPDKNINAFSVVLAVVMDKTGTFSWFQLVCDERTDGHTLLQRCENAS